ENWKIYPPKATFSSDDKIGHQGIKTFEYVIAPKKTGQIKIPALKFSYFDPKLKEYKTLDIDDTQEVIVSRSGNFTKSNDDDEPKAKSSKKDKIYDDSIIYVDTNNYPSLRSNMYSLWFWILNILMVSLGSILLMRIGFSSNNQKIAANKRKSLIKEEFSKAYNSALLALKVSDTKAFYEHARMAIVKKLELISGQKIDPGLHNIEEIFVNINLAEEPKIWLRSFLSESEIIVFSNHQPAMEKAKEVAKEFEKFVKNFGR
ncbi:MAG: BatD family protein, partial [Puniceicoccales bacterium]|nr:BatD family protein [Puniceicoccales bacterium]